MLTEAEKERLLSFQRNEITEHRIYLALAAVQKSAENRRVLERIADEERRHYETWKKYTGQDVEPDRPRIRWFGLVSRVFGFTFGVKLMEKGEGDAREVYGNLPETVREAAALVRDEGEHEDALIGMLDEERLRYVGSIVLGLNDALVELTGALAGLTFALRNTRLIALTGSITGVAAALSMAASEYLSTKTEGSGQSPVKAALYTGAAYIATVIALILPYLLLPGYGAALACTLVAAVTIIACFNYYISVARDLPFRRRFAEMAGLSLGVAGLSFLIGVLLRRVIGVEL